ncbi:ATP-binding protein [Spirosoma validum]|uniref:ATP-binding protein n=1 Tax=Spirosoma validum TaxID=2771355 RepID=A0A927GEL6_9BACT|nr:AAA family ATPase [Spirosoma validum]MBD2754808.1 ATP-binding protein [Spirosoma validum]
MLIHRSLYKTLQKKLGSNQVILLVGARRVGKTVLINQLADVYVGPKIVLNGEDSATAHLLSDQTIPSYQRWLGDTQLLLIDEVQAIPDFEKVLQFLVNSFPGLTILATSSSSFHIANQVNNFLTQHQQIYTLYPPAQLEIGLTETYLQTRQQLEERLIFGSYPEVLQMEKNTDRIDYLKSAVSSNLLKDIRQVEQVRNEEKMLQLLRLIAYQTGSEISYDDLSNQLQIDRNTVVRYLDLFANVFILFRLGGYSKSLRKEVTKSSKWYFFDNGIRNALINNFDLLSQRPDTNVLWENYLMAERLKRNAYLQNQAVPYFWRTYDQQELSWVEEANEQLSGYAFKWYAGRVRFPKGFQKAYPNATLSVINPENYLDFITHNYFNV